ncbi:hypothetical protein WR25_20223 [Diploscapter pachys]|uniref:Uncharacterized protein n=1 Tax=Diploscapter pachys TaxID=2018661 RepID=A0A2A2LQS4_9BILA|nr:hypothetical protein WR25_20223 [Diploscapter pachys]
MSRFVALSIALRQHEAKRKFVDENEVRRLLEPMPSTSLSGAAKNEPMTDEEATELVQSRIPLFIQHQGFQEFDVSVVSLLSTVLLENLKSFCRNYRSAELRKKANPTVNQQSPMLQCLTLHNLLPETRLVDHYQVCHRRRYHLLSRKCKNILDIPLNELEEILTDIRSFDMDPVHHADGHLQHANDKPKRGRKRKIKNE